MPSTSPPPSNQRRQDSLFGGQVVLLTASVATAALFSFLFIGSKLRDEQTRVPIISSTKQEPENSGMDKTPLVSPYEQSSVVVEQILHAETEAGKEAEKIIARTPAVYATGTLQWTPEQAESARVLKEKLAAVLRHQDAINRELQKLEQEWMELVRTGSPEQILRMDSPSLTPPPLSADQ